MPVNHPLQKLIVPNSLKIPDGPFIKENLPISHLDEAFKVTLKWFLKDLMRTCAMDECYGCEIDHPSQTSHYCIMAENEEIVQKFFDKSFQRLIDESEFMEMVWDKMKETCCHARHGLDRLKYCNKDSFTTLACRFRCDIKHELKNDNLW